MKKLFLICSVLLVISCQKEGNNPVEEEEVTSPTDSGVNSGGNVVYNVNKSTMLELINDVRSKGCNCGNTSMPPVAKLQWNDKLAKAAYLHSTDMNSNNYFSHNSQNGQSAGDRITVQGFNWSSYGENIAKGQANETAVMDAWLKSEGHCKNIMNERFIFIGAGMQNKYWTQVFGSMR